MHHIGRLSIPFYWDFPLKHQPFSLVHCSLHFQFPFIGIFRWNNNNPACPAYPSHKLSIPFYWDFPLKLWKVFGVDYEAEKQLSIPFYWDFPLKRTRMIDTAIDVANGFQFPFIGIFRWNPRIHLWRHPGKRQLSIPFYWDFPLKPKNINATIPSPARTFNSLLLGFSVETLKILYCWIFRYWIFQFPFIGIFRWNCRKSISEGRKYLVTFNSLLLGFSVETIDTA